MFKWSHIKSYYRKLSRGIDICDRWELRLDMSPKYNTKILNQEFVLIVTAKDNINTADIYLEVITELREKGFITNDRRLNNKLDKGNNNHILYRGSRISGMSNKIMYKLMSLALMGMLLIPFTGVVYFGLYSINNYYPETYQRYATGGRDDKNIFFSSEIDENTKVIDTINLIDFSEALADKRIQTVCKTINKNKNKIRKNLMANEAYMKYLDDNELTIDDFFSYAEKISALDDNFIKSSFFISCLIIIYICVVKFSWRKCFYWFAGIIYSFEVLSQFTGMQSDNLIYYALFQKTQTYDNYITTMPILLDALVQSILTFIIFDYLFQKYGDKRVVIIDNFLVDLNCIVDGIESRTITPVKIGESWRRVTYKFLRVCKKSARKYKRKKIYDKIFRQMDSSDEKQYLLTMDIQKDINDISCSCKTNINGYDKKLKTLRGKILLLKKNHF